MINALTTDLYQLTMAAGYWHAGLTESATFELFVRRLPPRRSFLVAAGLDDALDYLAGLRFTDEERAWLRALPAFAHVPSAFFDDYLRTFAFSGSVHAAPEGTPIFQGEPILRVTASLPEAQLAETALLATVAFATSVASKAVRVVHAAAGRPVIEFGARRAHTVGASIAAARAAFIGGCAGTSLTDAGRRYGIPTSGTMAHSWVQTFAHEVDAFREFSRTFPDTATYLLDTYDTVAATETLIASGLKPPMVRLDSGEVISLSRQVRAKLDAAGLTDTRIFATGDLDEYRIATIVKEDAPIDGFGVGTALSTVSDAPALSAVYKLVEVHRHGASEGVIKKSPGKQTWPCPKQVWRVMDGDRAVRDVIAGVDEARPAGGVGLLQKVMERGQRIGPPPSVFELRDRCRREVATLPERLHALDAPADYDVSVSAPLEAARQQAARYDR
ncbi:MAG TPA: nicotinate phosphoribosyltransferase [Vicinamibacterales bacterium]|nr:nicotinate phosphoribosyltransferase [Vicinamibacterales bacterium]